MSLLDIPTLHLPPKKVAPGTFLIQDIQHALGAPLSVYLNSAVIQGAEPVIVDTGSARNRDQWLQDVFGLVEPEDVRWVFLTHDDSDHTGNLSQVMDACPNATLVCSWTLVERFSNAYEFPLRRCRWLNDGESLDAGDRTLVALRPPVYDPPPPAACSTPRPASTGRPTRSPHRCPAGPVSPRSTPSRTSTPRPGGAAWSCSASTRCRRG